MKKLTSIVVGALLGLEVMACGPDEVNNYYGAGGANGGGATCATMADNYVNCKGPKTLYGNDEPETLDQMKARITALCLQGGKEGDRWLDQECLDCMSTAPCETYFTTGGEERKITPDEYCMMRGTCENADF